MAQRVALNVSDRAVEIGVDGQAVRSRITPLSSLATNHKNVTP